MYYQLSTVNTTDTKMKNLLLSLLTLFISSSSTATGVLSVRHSLIQSTDRKYFASNPELGLFVNEPLHPFFDYQSYSGLNMGQWFITEHYFMLNMFGEFKMGLGPTYGRNIGDTCFNMCGQNLGIKAYVEVKLW